MSKGRRIDTTGGGSLNQNPFGGLEAKGLPDLPAPPASENKAELPRKKEPRKRGRVEIRRVKAGRGGKIVTTATAFEKTGQTEIDGWAVELKKLCGTGGTAKPQAIEIQGDRREELLQFFQERGFRPVLAGG